MRYVLLDYLIYKNNPSILDTCYEFQTREWSFLSKGKETFVLHKKQLKYLNIKEIWDGMEIPLLISKKERDSSSYKLNHKAYISGISIYQWFDEKVGEKQYYAYGIDRSKLDSIHSVLEHTWSDITLEDSKFIRIKNWDFDLWVMQHMLDDWDIVSILSCIFGIGLIYGHAIQIDDALSHMVIHVPLVDSIALLEDQLLQMIQILWDHQLYMTYDYQDRKSGQTLQIGINDQEILDLYSQWMWWKKYDISLAQWLLQEELWEERDLSNYVLKFLHK